MTVSVRLSGEIVGMMWMGCAGSLDINATYLKNPIAESLKKVLCSKGGDFQDPKLASNSALVFEFRIPKPYGYDYLVRQYNVGDCPSL